MPLSNPASPPPTPVNLDIKSTTVSPFNIGVSKISVDLVPPNPNRKGATIWNESGFDLYVECGKVASPSAFCAKLTPGSYYEIPYGYTGIVSGVWLPVEGKELKGLAMVREFI